MLKFFRQYNKYILAVGCVVLMIAFLVPQFAQQYAPNPMNRVVGQVHGKDIIESDLVASANEVQLLGELFRRASIFNLVPYDREQWMLMTREAHAMGLRVSQAEINTALSRLGIADAEQLTQLSLATRMPEETLRAIVGKWLVSERYKLLVTGRRMPQTANRSGSSPKPAAPARRCWMACTRSSSGSGKTAAGPDWR